MVLVGLMWFWLVLMGSSLVICSSRVVLGGFGPDSRWFSEVLGMFTLYCAIHCSPTNQRLLANG